MKRFYSQTTLVTYLEGIHRVMPADAKEISEARYLEVLGNPEPGKVRGHDADGLPILIDTPPEDLAAQERAWRDAEILRVQWIRDRHRDQVEMSRNTTITAGQFNECVNYIQDLRGWPQADAFPNRVQRPSTPEWLDELLRKQ